MKPINIYHRKLVDWISALGLLYTEEYGLDNYSLDIYLPEMNLGVEVDGPQHNRKRDRARDEIIMDKGGITIVRIKVGTRKAEALEAILEYAN